MTKQPKKPGEEQQSLAVELSQPLLVDEDVADGLLGQARRRRLKEGADTSMPAFKQAFQELRTIAKRSLDTVDDSRTCASSSC